LLFFHFVLTWALKTDALCLPNYLDSLDRETGEEPTEGELFLGDSRSKYYWINREVFILEKGVLWKEGDEGKTARRVVPKMYREHLPNHLDSLDTFPSKSISRFPRRDPDLRHPRSHFFFLLILTLSHGFTPRSICQGDHVIYILIKTGPWKEGDEGKTARRVVPKMYREQIVKLCHDPPLAGHQGIERTIEKVKSRYYWRFSIKHRTAAISVRGTIRGSS
jgi:hypothetical protein